MAKPESFDLYQHNFPSCVYCSKVDLDGCQRCSDCPASFHAAGERGTAGPRRSGARPPCALPGLQAASRKEPAAAGASRWGG